MAAQPGQKPRILAWAEAQDGFVLGGPAVLSYGSEREWTHVGWHQIERGGWNAETRRLSWQQHGGKRGAVELVRPGRLPELFRERIEASIVMEKFVALAGERGVIVTARRDLGSAGTITWHSTLTRGLSWQTDGVRDAVDAVMAEVRTEYDLA